MRWLLSIGFGQAALDRPDSIGGFALDFSFFQPSVAERCLRPLFPARSVAYPFVFSSEAMVSRYAQRQLALLLKSFASLLSFDF